MIDYDTSKFRKCGVHGLQSIDQYRETYAQRKNGKKYQVFKCLACGRAKKKAKYYKDPQANHDGVNAWRRANKEKSGKIIKKCYAKHQKEYTAAARARVWDKKQECLKAYSPEVKCALCPENIIEFLVLDHIDGGGTKHREEIGKGSIFYNWIIKNNFPTGYRVLCHNCNFKELLRHNREKMLSDLQKVKFGRKRALKIKCIKAYSEEMKCNCCSNNDIEVLSIDHVEGGGRKHTRDMGISSGDQFYRWLMKNSFPEGFQILCLNCNFAKGHHSECPHKL